MAPAATGAFKTSRAATRWNRMGEEHYAKHADIIAMEQSPKLLTARSSSESNGIAEKLAREPWCNLPHYEDLGFRDYISMWSMIARIV